MGKTLKTTFRQRVNAGERLIGTIVSLADPSVSEIMLQAGFDWLWIDGEHSALDISTIQLLAQAAGDSPVMVRVPAIDEAWVKKTLEAGVDGVVFPLVNTPELAERAVALSKYPPLGQRSVGVARAQGYGASTDEYLRTANERLCTMVQIEHYKGVENLESILAVPGVDAVLVGPLDLSASMGKPGHFDDPNIRSTIEYVRQTCSEAAMPVGIFCGTAERARMALEQGYNFVVAGVDAMLLQAAASELRKAIQSE
jgi:2-keto-3-deoxy-L-rhamnonate aldolase RhmA